MRLKIAMVAALAAGVSLGLTLIPGQPAEATPQTSQVTLDFSAYSTAPEFAVTKRADNCIVMNPGTPECYQMCDTPPRLRTCEEE